MLSTKILSGSPPFLGLFSIPPIIHKFNIISYCFTAFHDTLAIDFFSESTKNSTFLDPDTVIMAVFTCFKLIKYVVFSKYVGLFSFKDITITQNNNIFFRLPVHWIYSYRVLFYFNLLFYFFYYPL